MLRGLTILFEIFLGTLLLLSPVLIIQYSHFVQPYSLFEYQEFEDLSPTMEIQRIFIVFAIAYFVYSSTYHSNAYIPPYLAEILASRAKDDKISSALEMIYLSWPYLIFCTASFILLIAMSTLFRSPGHVDEIPLTERPWQFYFLRVCLLCFLLSIVLLIEKIGIKKLTIDFHKAAYAERFQANRFALWATETLLAVSESKTAKRERSVRRLSLPTNTKIPSPPPRSPSSIAASSQPSVMERATYQGEVDVSLVFHYLTQDAESINFKVTGENQVVAWQIFNTLSNTNTDLLSITDIEPYFQEKLVDRAWSVFSKAGSATLSSQAFHNAITAIFEERYNLVLTSHDHNRVVNRLDRVALTVALIICSIIFLLLLEFPVQDMFTPLAPLVVGIIILTAPSLKTIFDSVVFLFMTHPYDVGDRIYMEGENMFVQEIGLLSTTFLTWDSKLLFLSNAVLANKTICNVRRSLSQVQQLSIQFSKSLTTTSKLVELQHRIKAYLKEHPDLFHLKFNFYVSEITNQNIVNVIIHIRHIANFQWGIIRWDRCNQFTYFLRGAMDELHMKYEVLDTPVDVDFLPNDRYSTFI